MTHDLLMTNTPFGDLSFFVLVDGIPPTENDGEFVVTTSRMVPELPPGMTVEGCYCAVLRADSSRPLNKIHFEARWQTATIGRPGPESGQFLDAQSWKTPSHVALIGTEDDEMLAARIPFATHRCAQGIQRLVSYLDTGLAIELPHVPAATPFSLHFVVAWNPNPEPADCSCWYAVDCPHGVVLRCVGAR